LVATEEFRERMRLTDIIEYWKSQRKNAQGKWTHPDDDHVLSNVRHSFNLDYPLGPFIGDLPKATVIVLGANGGFNEGRTPIEFGRKGWHEEYLERMQHPSNHDWRVVDDYYRARNYYGLLGQRQLVLVNACAYRSPSISNEPENRSIIAKLPSAQFTRRWLMEAVLPMASRGQRLVVVKRSRLWRLDAATRVAPGLVVDKAPISPDITGEAWSMAVRAVGG
jgi:hypothetical protein